MEAFIQVAVLIAVFALGISFGAILESKLMKFRSTEERLRDLENTTQEIKIVMSGTDNIVESVKSHTWVDYEMIDPDATQEFNLNG